jgi:hypothetical protein
MAYPDHMNPTEKQIIAACDETALIFHETADGRKVASVLLVHGNGSEVISDCSDNDATSDILKRAEEIADRLA